MKADAALKAWWELYEVVNRIGEQEPWKRIAPADYICIRIKETEEIAVVSVKGQEDGQEKGVDIYLGEKGMQDYFMLQEIGTGKETYLSEDFARYDRTALTCTWMEKKKLPEVQQQIPKLLNLDMEKKSLWPCFLSWQPRFMPRTPDEKEVEILKEIMRNLFMCLQAVEQGKLKVSEAKGQKLCRIFNKETGFWNMFFSEIPESRRKALQGKLHDEAKNMLLAKPVNERTVQIAFAYSHLPKRIEQEKMLEHPLLFAAVDEKTEELLSRYELHPQELEINILIQFVMKFAEQYGRMETLVLSDPWLCETAEKLLEGCGIRIVPGSTEKAERHLRMFCNRM